MRKITQAIFFLFFFLFAHSVLAEDAANADVGILHLYTFTIFLAIGIFFTVMMHKHSDNLGASITFGVMGASWFLILFAMIVSGYTVVISSTVFFIRTDYLISLMLLGLAMYSGLNARFIYRQGKAEQALAATE